MEGLTDSGRQRLTTSIVAGTIVVLSVALRFWCKLKLKGGVHAEDWWILAAVPIYLGAVADDIWGLLNGISGENLDDIIVALLQNPPPELVLAFETYLKSLYIGYVLYIFLVTTIRFSILLLYRRIFSTPRFRLQTLIMMGVSLAWFITSIVFAFTYCIPLEKFWRPLAPGRCLNFNLFYFVIGILETAIDLIILVLPVRATFAVQLPLRTKFFVSGIFLLGIFVIATDVLRIYKIYRPGQIYIEFTESIFWTHIHSLVAVLCANLPIYKPLRAKVVNFFSSIQKSFGSSLRSLRGDTRQRIGDSADGPEASFDLKTMPSDSPMGTHKRPEGSLEESRYPILDNRGGTYTSMADRSDASMDTLIIPSRGIVRTTKVDVF
ncbi:hypothetical protein NUW58_g459 [Xylaria curta]|uniref:Uncharacterized protein n=2 Tax=Xylaria curta TaxID=42375 RepID=A0ACC1PP56_9PEZI|nr:hypothetical protein NUW58_g6942 [Xylaria curta]KAJ2998007.1 hypothetical protein NUW58_g459 [Xylaria curta]